MRGLSLVVASGGHSSSRCAGLSLSRLLPLRSTGSRRAGSVIVAHGPSCSAACGIFPDQGSNPCPLHWQADSQPLHHQGSPSFLDNKNGHENLSESPTIPKTNLPAHHFQAPLAFEVKFCYTLRLWLSESQCITELCLESFLAATHLGMGGKNRPLKSFEHGPKLVVSFSIISI